MELVSLKQFADEQKVTYQAVWKQVVRYEKELTGHIIKDNNTQYLDETAVEFLKEKRKKQPIILMNMDKDEEIESLKAQLSAVKDALIAVQEQLAKSKDDLIKEKDKVIVLQDNAVKYNALLEDHQKKEAELQEAKAEAEMLKKERDDAQADVQSFRKSIFGFYRKK